LVEGQLMATPFSYDAGLVLIEDNKASLPVAEFPQAADKDAYVAAFRAYLSRSDDHRVAVQIAVDAAKSLIAIGIAFFAAIGALLVQYTSSHAFSIWGAEIPMALAAILAVASMVGGFKAIGTAYNNAMKITQPLSPAWNTKPLESPLAFQSIAGLVALVSFAWGVIVWNHGNAGGITVAPTTAAAASPSAAGKFTVEGTWSRLAVKHGGIEVALPPTAAGQTAAFEIDMR
jgi:hypothetical protein